MRLEHILVFLSIAISLVGSSAYIIDTLAGRTKPNRVSWFLWAAAPLVAVAAAHSAGADPWALARVFMAGFMPLIIFLCSFSNTSSYWQVTRFDIACGLFSIIALIIWAALESPIAAILLLAIADGFATLPTLVKAWRYPDSETGITYILVFVATLLVLPSISVWNIQNVAFQIYLLMSAIALIISVYRQRIISLPHNILTNLRM
ncbi:hypothetical protein HZA86_04600 [Candidatus Uhrbacteria bacterium]|nr:hypothetical protein [Candidatus Uhrbacteria bacterium]